MKAKGPANDYPMVVEVGLVGSCTNSSYQDLARAASVARQRFEGLAVESAGNAVANVFAARGVNLVRPWIRSPGIGHGTGPMYDVRNTRTLNLGKSADYAQSIIPDFGLNKLFQSVPIRSAITTFAASPIIKSFIPSSS